MNASWPAAQAHSPTPEVRGLRLEAAPLADMFTSRRTMASAKRARTTLSSSGLLATHSPLHHASGYGLLR